MTPDRPKAPRLFPQPGVVSALACALLLSACATGSEVAMSADAPDGALAAESAGEGAHQAAVVSLTGPARAGAPRSARAPIYVSGNVLLPSRNNVGGSVSASLGSRTTADIGLAGAGAQVALGGRASGVQVTSPALDAGVSRAGVTAVARLDPLAGVGRGGRAPLTAAAHVGRGGVSAGAAGATGSLIDATRDTSGSSKAVRQAVTRARRLQGGS